VCRLANVYGERQVAALEGGVVAIFLDRLLAGQPTEIFGDGGQTRDFIYVGDVVDGLLAATASAPGGGIYNLGSGVATSVLELHRLCAAVAGREQEPHLAPPRAGDVRHSVLDPSRAARELGWRPRVELAAGLARTAGRGE
jgi:UDP-glucose 4-epimerase